MFVKPAEGRVVRRPDTLVHLRPEGEDVPNTEFWVRRLRDGDVVEAEVSGHAYEFGGKANAGRMTVRPDDVEVLATRRFDEPTTTIDPPTPPEEPGQ